MRTIISRFRPSNDLKNQEYGCNENNLTKIQINEENKFEFPVLYFANARSLPNKIDELTCELKLNKVDIAVITETWLNMPIPDQSIDI